MANDEVESGAKVIASLDELAAAIKQEHTKVEARIRDSMLHARRAGELLIEVKAKLAHGHFGQWIQAHCGFSWRTANLYMRVAAEWDRQLSQHVANLTLHEVAQVLTNADAGDVAEEAIALADLGILDPAHFDGLGPHEARVVVRALRSAYDAVVEDPDRGKHIPHLDDPRWTNKNPCPLATFNPPALRARGSAAIAALRAGEIGLAQFERAFARLMVGDDLGFWRQAHIKVARVAGCGRMVVHLPCLNVFREWPIMDLGARFYSEAVRLTQEVATRTVRLPAMKPSRKTPVTTDEIIILCSEVRRALDGLLAAVTSCGPSKGQARAASKRAARRNLKLDVA